MDNLDTLRSLAEVAVALTGFTGIVAILGHRSRGEWSPLEWLRLRMLLETSLAVLFFSLIPLLLQQLYVSLDIFWRISNGIQAVTHVFGGFLLYYRVKRLEKSQWPKEEQLLTLILLPISIIIIFSQLTVSLGDLIKYGYFVYLLGLIYFILLATVHFVLLLIPVKK